MAFLCGIQALSKTNQQLLQDGLISPLVFELLERQGAKTPEQRYAVIQGACRASQLPASRLWSVETPKELLIKRRLGVVLAIEPHLHTGCDEVILVVLHLLQGQAERASSELIHLRFNP